MQSLKAHVQNGRLVMDVPTDLPEGQILELVLLDEVLADDEDDLDDAQRGELHAALRESFHQAKSGQTIDAAEALGELRRHR